MGNIIKFFVFFFYEFEHTKKKRPVFLVFVFWTKSHEILNDSQITKKTDKFLFLYLEILCVIWCGILHHLLHRAVIFNKRNEKWKTNGVNKMKIFLCEWKHFFWKPMNKTFLDILHFFNMFHVLSQACRPTPCHES